MSNPRILLVDDEELFVTTLAKRMERRDLSVMVAGSGEEALELARNQRFDAVVLDLAMPGIDGIETLQRLRELNPDCQALLLSGHGTVKSGVEAMKLGAVDFLEKPVELDDLLVKVHEAVQRTEKLGEQRAEEQVDQILHKKGW